MWETEPWSQRNHATPAGRSTDTPCRRSNESRRTRPYVQTFKPPPVEILKNSRWSARVLSARRSFPSPNCLRAEAFSRMRSKAFFECLKWPVCSPRSHRCGSWGGYFRSPFFLAPAVILGQSASRQADFEILGNLDTAFSRGKLAPPVAAAHYASSHYLCYLLGEALLLVKIGECMCELRELQRRNRAKTVRGSVLFRVCRDLCSLSYIYSDTLL